jgi:hypothetical protein
MGVSLVVGSFVVLLRRSAKLIRIKSPSLNQIVSD